MDGNSIELLSPCLVKNVLPDTATSPAEKPSQPFHKDHEVGTHGKAALVNGHHGPREASETVNPCGG